MRLQRVFEMDLADVRVLIVGLGETGMSVARFLRRQQIRFAVTDSREKPPLYDSLIQEMPDIPLFLGGFSHSAFAAATHLIVSPGVSLKEPAVMLRLESGVKTLSDIDLFACAVEGARITAITGSNGKSTVTTLLGLMAREAGVETRVGANLGTPALDLIDEKAELYVIELSSFQLERTTKLNASTAVVLNVTPDHMDRYNDLADYAYEKSKVFQGNGIMILNEDDPMVRQMKQPDREVITFALQRPADFHLAQADGCEWLAHGDRLLLKTDELQLQGRHNVMNALAALALGFALGLPEQPLLKALRAFKGLEHRMQKVAEINDVTWINDSKATNIGACIAALQGFENKVILIAGGDGKGADMSELASVFKEKVKVALLIGRDAGIIEKAVGDVAPMRQAGTLDEAVKIAAEIAEAGDIVLLSPACASLDQFKNYQERGRKFTEAVMRLAA